MITLTAKISRPSCRVARLVIQGAAKPCCTRLQLLHSRVALQHQELIQNVTARRRPFQVVITRSCSTNRRDSLKFPGIIQHHDDPERQSKDSKLEHRSKLSKSLPREAHFHVLGQGSPGGPRSLLLYTDCEKFMFNCGEGTARQCKEFAMARLLIFVHSPKATHSLFVHRFLGRNSLRCKSL